MVADWEDDRDLISVKVDIKSPSLLRIHLCRVKGCWRLDHSLVNPENMTPLKWILRTNKWSHPLSLFL